MHNTRELYHNIFINKFKNFFYNPVYFLKNTAKTLLTQKYVSVFLSVYKKSCHTN